MLLTEQLLTQFAGMDDTVGLGCFSVPKTDIDDESQREDTTMEQIVRCLSNLLIRC